MILLRARTLGLVVALIVAIGTAGCAARGQRAIERMTPDQREFIAHGLTSFSPRTTPEDLDAAFGPPLEASRERRLWRRAGSSPGERIEAWFEAGQLVRLRIFDRGDAHRRAWHRCVPIWTWDLVAHDGRLVPVAG